MKDKLLVNKINVYIILKQRKNLIKSLILKMVNFQEKVDLVKLENVLVNQINLIQLKNQVLIYKVNLINIYKNNIKLIVINQKNQIMNNIKKFDLNIIIFY